MANQKFSSDELKMLINRIDEGDLHPASIAKKYGTKDAVLSKYQEIENFLNKAAPDPKASPEAFDLWKSAKSRLQKQFEVGKKYAPTLASPSTAMEQLATGNTLKVAAKDDAAKILEQKASAINPLEYKLQQNRGIATPNIMDVQDIDIAGAKKQALENLLLNPKVAKAEGMASKAVGKLPKVGGGGKLGALAALGTLGYQAFNGQPASAAEVFKAGAEVINPLPFSMEEMKTETDKMNPMAALEKLKAAKEQEKMDRESAATPGALEFGDKLQEMQQNPEVEPVMSARKEELRRRLSGY